MKVLFTLLTAVAFFSTVEAAAPSIAISSAHQETPTERAISDRIRYSISRDKNFSNNARAIEVNTKGTIVTLKGAVNSDAEKQRLNSLAVQTTGVDSVNNQLEVKVPGVK